jgi:sterol desaturase/sphingolipid hydroxylase (fatty acid hydroxylase superfamily)
VLFLTGTQLAAQSTQALIVIGLFFSVTGALAHSHIPLSFGCLNRFVQAPVLHQIHHSMELRHRDKNFGGFLMDWLFGTLYLPTGHEQFRLGLNDDEVGPTNPHLRLRNIYLEPFAYLWRLIRRHRMAL